MLPCEDHRGCPYGEPIKLNRENYKALEVWRIGELLGYETAFKILDFKLTKEEFLFLIDRLELIKKLMVEIQNRKIENDGKKK